MFIWEEDSHAIMVKIISIGPQKLDAGYAVKLEFRGTDGHPWLETRRHWEIEYGLMCGYIRKANGLEWATWGVRV